MKKYIAILLSCVMGLTMLTGCHTHQHHHHKNKHKPHHKQKIHKSPRHHKHYGSVTNIEMFAVVSDSSSGDVILGAIAEGEVGQQMGSGDGRDVATGVGVIGAAIARNEIEKLNESTREMYRITVSVDNGEMQQFDYEEIEDLQIGDRVKIENGHLDLI